MSVSAGLARRSVGVGGLWFFAVSASAPMTALVGGVVTSYGHTGVVGMPVSFLLLTAVLWLLTVGYVAMNRYVAHAAPFYALLALGLGRRGVSRAVWSRWSATTRWRSRCTGCSAPRWPAIWEVRGGAGQRSCGC